MAQEIPVQVIDELRHLGEAFDEQLAAAKSEHELRQVKAAFLGKQGQLSGILKSLGSLSPEERPRVGQQANTLKLRLESSFQAALQKVQADRHKARLGQERLDPTLPGLRYPSGSIHPVSQVMQTVQEIFERMGFEVREGPEIETEFYNFEALNIPSDHPARDMQDTFYLADDPTHLLRTHTSPVQIHVMQQTQPPIQMIAPGPVYRRDSDVTHTPVFHQIEGLLVDKDISFAHLKGVLEIFLLEFFGPDTAVRFRPSYFPFTEPSAEVDVRCKMFGDRGDEANWLEVMGCGMVHPEVFKAVHYDPTQWSGFAFGMGIERLAMLKYQINDIRLFYENDLRFLEQFR